MPAKRNLLVYGVLAIGWLASCAWQIVEHNRQADAVRQAMLTRSDDITDALGVVIRSQRRFGGMTRRPNLEAAMEELVKSEEIRTVELLDIYGVPIETIEGEPLAAGEAIEFDFEDLSLTGPVWTEDSLMVVHEVELQPLLDEEDRGGRGWWGRRPRRPDEGKEGLERPSREEEEGRERYRRRPPGITEEQHQIMMDYFTSSTLKT